MIAYLASRKTTHWGFRAGAVALFFCALLSKEAAISFTVVLFLTDLVLNHGAHRSIQISLVRSLKSVVPFAVAAVIFIVLRYSMIHSLRELAPGAPGLGSVLLTIPSMLIFYLRQIFFPFQFGPVYGLRYVNSTNVGLMNFLMPLTLIAVLAYVARWLYKRETVYKIGLIWLFLPLTLVLDPRIFVPELLVQDRYLYLPVFGAAMLVASGIIELASLAFRARARSAELAAFSVGLLICVGLDLITLSFNPVWANGVALWEHGVKVDPTSALANVQLANEYQRLGRLPEAKEAVSRAIQLRPEMTNAYLTRGVISVRERRYQDAEADLTRVLNAYPSLDAPREQLALAYQQQGRLEESIALFDEGRRIIPAKQAVYTVNIAVLHKLANRDAEALSSLESLLPVLKTTNDPDLLAAWWYLGELYREQGRTDNAVAAYDRYLKATESGKDPKVDKQRDLAVQRLSQIKR
jgi:tetratricopeptide (TPR) repeat protein